MTFFRSCFPLSVACNEVLKYIVQRFNSIVFCSVHVTTEYIPNIVASANMSNDFVNRAFRRIIPLSGPIGFRCICLASRGLLMRAMIIDSVQAL